MHPFEDFNGRAVRVRVAESMRRVHPGDYLVADRDGICMIPFFDVPQVVEHCERAHLAETAFIDRIDAAPSVEDLVAGLSSGATPA
ncbi:MULTISPECIES: hypothetical protein [unclassified Rhodococcus (in: high G+C Gram-positive bacteria)]|uniref:hypothetical protein n=1 Tax=unclassified Rhodococcus (in: high G+C Gram-positive bacteria) TaxID=192944 RepID=UPI0009295CD7|nr:hypothetical protein [Rhodococcus sp. M8]